MKRFGVVGHLDRPLVKKITEKIIQWAKDNGIECRICENLAELVGDKNALSEKNEIWKHSDIIISLGGDGSMLSSARIAGPHDIPIFGINLGSLGFLTEVSEDHLCDSLGRIKNDDFRIEERMMLELTAPDLSNQSYLALNDIVLDHGNVTNLIKLDLYSNDQFVCSYNVDGIVVSTPTGSTAYSLAVGGPIINPLMDAIIVSPIAPHTLTLRPIVFPAADKISIRTVVAGRKVRVSADGQILGNIENGQAAEVKKSDHRLKLIKLSGRSFYEILRSKLNWGARPLLNS